jgi:hypothetical protein
MNINFQLDNYKNINNKKITNNKKKIANNNKNVNVDFKKKINEIIDFIAKSNNDKIKNQLFNVIKYDNFCYIIIGENIVGEGFVSKVYIPEVNISMPYMFGNKKVDLPIIIKESKHLKKINYFNIDIIDKKLYIFGFRNITTEALILIYIRKLYDKTVHLPLILGYGTCIKKNIINRIITYRYGLEKNITIDLSSKIFKIDKLWNNFYDKKQNIFSSSISTLKELFTYIHYSKNTDGSVIFPNGIKCDNISELYDYISISYLATHQLLTNNHIYPIDMHSHNIFIHWLNDSSYYNGENIKNVKEIVYKINNKYYKIKTFGFVIILGDTGNFIINVKEDVMIVGQLWNIKVYYKFLKKIIDSKYTNTNFLFWNLGYLTQKEFNNSIISKIMNSEPYCNFPHNTDFLFDISYTSKLKSILELLEFYDEKYRVDKFEKNNYNILINID